MKKEIEIIMATGSTEKEAEKHLKNGAIIYTEEEKEDFIESCINGCMEPDEAEEAWKALDEVEYKGTTYKINFVL